MWRWICLIIFNTPFPALRIIFSGILPPFNAQASVAGAAKNVTVYGGLARHPDLPSAVPVCTDNLNAGVAVMKSAQDGA
jgi:hypothetical protein